MNRYKELKIYQKSYETAKEIYEKTKKFPREEIYGITSQIRRAALSIPLNITEGYAKRESQAEYKRFLTMAIGSSNEMQVLIDFTKDIGYINEEEHKELSEEYEEISRMLNGYIKALNSRI